MCSLIFYFQLYLMPLLQNGGIPILKANSTLWLGHEQNKKANTQKKKRCDVLFGGLFLFKFKFKWDPKVIFIVFNQD